MLSLLLKVRVFDQMLMQEGYMMLQHFINNKQQLEQHTTSRNQEIKQAKWGGFWAIFAAAKQRRMRCFQAQINGGKGR